MIPPPVVEVWEGIHVVRDDKLAGGSKRRFLDHFIGGVAREVVYATPAYGGAQIAIAEAARQAGKRATLFVAKRRDLHPRTADARDRGAKIVEVPHGYLSHVQAKARAYCEETGAMLLPFGLDTERARRALAIAAILVRQQHGVFDEVWSAAGSGMLSRSLQEAKLGRAYVAVAVGREPQVGSARLIRHGQPFEAAVAERLAPPFPSCSNYDAKVWQYLVEHRRITAPSLRLLFWNVMG